MLLPIFVQMLHHISCTTIFAQRTVAASALGTCGVSVLFWAWAAQNMASKVNERDWRVERKGDMSVSSMSSLLSINLFPCALFFLALLDFICLLVRRFDTFCIPPA